MATVTTKRTNPYLVTRRIMENGKLWGAVIKYRGEEFKIDKDSLINLTDTNQVIVDTVGADIPVFLTTILVNGKRALRTIRDGVIKNNFASVKSKKLISCNKLKIKKK